MDRPSLPRITLPSRRHVALACGAVSIGVIGALLLGPSPVDPTAAPEQDPPEDSIVGQRYEDVATAELTGARGKPETARFVPRQVTIGFERSATPAQETAAIAAVDGKVKERLPMPGVVLIQLHGSLGVDAAQRKIDALPGVRYAEPNVIYQLSDTTPTDPYYPYLWGMENIGQEVLSIKGTPDADIDAGAAWDVTKGSRDVVAAVIDTGVDFEHEDLAQQIWTNPRDPKNGVDDDRNGFVDDTNGWDFVNADNRPDDDHYHGTHVAGTIAARTDDGKGVVGVAPNSSILPVKVLSSSGSGTNAQVASGFDYAGRMGAKVANASLGCSGCFSQLMLDVIKSHPDTLYAIAAGNSAASNETNPHYPCSYDADNIICVAATDSSDQLASFSNWGATRVDLAAPGVKILSDIPGIGGDDRKVLFSEDFEEPLPANWTTTGTQDRWGVTDEKAYSGNGSLTDRPYENYRAGDAGRIYSPAFDLTKETDCRWGMTGIWDPAKGDAGFNGRSGTVSDKSGSGWSRSVSNGNPGVFDDQGISVYGGSAPNFRMYLELNAGSQANGGRGVFADNFWLTCADNSTNKPVPPSRYGYLNGTSMATPHVAGAVALLAAANPQMNAQTLKDRILSSVDPVPSLAGKTVTGGRLNVARALRPSASVNGTSTQSPGTLSSPGSGTTPSGATEPQPVDTSLYGKDRYLPWAEDTESDPKTAGDEVIKTYSPVNTPPATLLGERVSSTGGYQMLNGQWGLDNGGQNAGTSDADIDAPEAWSVTRGSDRVTVALMSSGYPLDHPGLADNIAVNPGESGGGKETNGLDDDRNGYIDDWRGLWTNSYASGRTTGLQTTQPIADNAGQGTMAASLIAGDPSQGGRIFGISPKTKILPIKTVGAGDFDVGRGPGSASADDIAEGIKYAGKMKVDIAVLPTTSDAFGDLQGMTELISAYPRTLFVAPTELYFSKGAIPACTTGLVNLVCVRPSTRTDGLLYPTRTAPGVDLAAPGGDMVATDQEWEYREAANFDGAELPGVVTAGSSSGLVGVSRGQGMNGGGALAFSPERDLPRGASVQFDFTDIQRPPDIRSCGTTLRFSRNASLGQTIGIRSWADPWYLKYTTQRISGRGRFTELTSFWSGLMESASLGWLRKWSVLESAPSEAWTSRDLIDSFGYTCPKTNPSGSSLAWTGNLQPEYYGLDAALVGGTASLVKSEHPGFTPSQIKRALLDGADRITALNSMIPGGRRLNAAGALAAATSIEPPADQPQLKITSGPEATNDSTPTFGFWSRNAKRLECGFEPLASGAVAWSDCSASTEHTPANPLPDGAYMFRVRAIGNSGAIASDAASITVDNQSPAAPARVTASNTPTNLPLSYLQYTVRGERDGTFECRIEGMTEWSSCGEVTRLADAAEARYRVYVNDSDEAAKPADGDYTFRARQIDPAGNVSPEFSYALTIDRVAPESATLISTPPDVVRTNAATVTWSRDASSWTTDLYLDGTRAVIVGGSTGTPSTRSYTFRGLSEGRHVIRLVTRDQANNEAKAVEVAFEVQTDPLRDAPVFDPANPILTRSSFPVIWFSGSNAGTYECSVDNGTFSACTPPWTRNTTLYPTFKEGPHSLRVRQVTPSGEFGPVSEFLWVQDGTPPSAPSISSGPSGLTAFASASFAFSGEAGASFECQLDSGGWSACTSPKPYASIADGSHTFQVRQTDGAGNISLSTSRSWTVDTVAPIPPTLSSGPSGVIASKTATFSFSGESSAAFQCQLDADEWMSCASGRSYSSLAEGPHTFRVRQIDLAGNSSQASSRTWTVDTTPPDAPGVTGAPSGTVASKSAELSLAGEDGASFTCSINSTDFQPCASPKTYSDLVDGSHTVRVKQRDVAGNESPITTKTWTIDTTAPDAPGVTGAPSGTVASKSAELSLAGEDGASFTCSIDSTDFQPCSSPKTYSGLADGSHTVRVKQRDIAGNESPVTSRAWMVDTTAPDAPGVAGAPSGTVASASAEMRFSGEAGASFACSIDGSEFSPCTSPKTYAGLSDGSHTVRVRQRDSVGNESSSAERSWVVDTTAPTAPTIEVSPQTSTSLNAATFGFSGEDGASFTCSIDGSGFEPCQSPVSFVALSDGSHRFEVRQSDAVGNTSAAAGHEWSVDATPAGAPEIASGPQSLTSSTAAAIQFSGESGATYGCSLDGAPFAPCTSPKAYGNLSDGVHTFRVRQTDPLGNQSVPNALSWTVDSRSPDTPTILSGPSGLVASTTAQFSFEGEPGSRFLCSLDGASPTDCNSPHSISALSDGRHEFSVWAEDAAGNRSQATLRDWSIDTGAPSQPQIISAPDSLTPFASAEFAFAGERGSSFSCSLDGAAFSACSSPKSYSNISDGSHRFEVRQTDSAGHTSPIASHTWSVAEVLGRTAAVAGPDASGLLTFSGAGDRFSYLCRVNSTTAPLEPCQSPLAPVGLVNGTYPIRVAVVDSNGNRSAITQTNFTVSGTPAPPSGQVGVSVNDAAIFSNNPMVNLSLVWPAGARQVIVSNDGSLSGSPSAVMARMPWLLATSGMERLPKTVYVRYLGAGGAALATVQDDIILDQTAPVVISARVSKKSGATYTFLFNITEQGSGLNALEISSLSKKPLDSVLPKLTSPYSSGSFTKRLDAAPTWIRFRDTAGNWSRWTAVTN